MNVRLSLRILLVLHVLMLVVGVALSFFDGYLLPDTLAEWKDAQLDEDALSLTDLLLLGLWLGWLGGYLVSVVGLFLQQRWAAWLSLGLTVLGLVFTLLLWAPSGHRCVCAVGSRSYLGPVFWDRSFASGKSC